MSVTAIIAVEELPVFFLVFAITNGTGPNWYPCNRKYLPTFLCALQGCAKLPSIFGVEMESLMVSSVFVLEGPLNVHAESPM